MLLLHNPDRVGYTSPAVWEAMAGLREAGLCNAIGVAPGPANGFTLDVIGCLERFGDLIDWAMLILNPLEPWPGGWRCRPASATACACWRAWSTTAGCSTTTCPTRARSARPTIAATARPAGSRRGGRASTSCARSPTATASRCCSCRPPGRSPSPRCRCVAPTLIQEAGAAAKPVEAKRAELAAVPREPVLDEAELAAIAAIGDNTGCMALKGASPRHEGAERPDAWPLDDELREVGRRFGIEADRDLVRS